MHTGSKANKSKTEVLFVLKRDGNDSVDLSPISLSNRSRITFANQLTYLGSIISSDLSNEVDVDHRIAKANQAFGSLRSLIFRNPFLPLAIKRYFYISICVNLLFNVTSTDTLYTYLYKKYIILKKLQS